MNKVLKYLKVLTLGQQAGKSTRGILTIRDIETTINGRNRHFIFLLI